MTYSSEEPANLEAAKRLGTGDAPDIASGREVRLVATFPLCSHVLYRPFLVDYIQSLILERLEQPHAGLSPICISASLAELYLGHEDTFQSYSSFTTTYKSASEYESLLVSASKSRSRAVKAYERREATELALVRHFFFTTELPPIFIDVIGCICAIYRLREAAKDPGWLRACRIV